MRIAPMLSVLSIFVAACVPAVAPMEAASDAEAARRADVGAGTEVSDANASAQVPLSPVITVAGAPMVVLAVETDPSWGIGLAWDAEPPVDEDDEDRSSLVAERAVDLARLPASITARARTGWTLVGRASRCSARLGTPVLVRRVDGWMFGDEAPADPVPFADPTSFPARAWPYASEILAAPLASSDGACGDATFAFESTTRIARILRPVEGLDDAARAEARAAFEALPAYRELADAYAEYLRTDGSAIDGPTWTAYDGTDSTSFTLLRDEAGDELVLVSAHAELLCGGFEGSLYAVLERTPNGLVAIDQGVYGDMPDVIVDGADGQRIYVGREQLRTVGGGRSSVWVDAVAPFVGCPC